MIIVLKKFLGIIDETVHFDVLKELAENRSVGAIPFAGRYRLIDFPLSYLYHLGVKNVAIYSNEKNQSLSNHIGSGKVWDLDRTQDGLFFFPKPNESKINSPILSFKHIKEHIEYLLKSEEEYVIITNSYIICVIDFKDVLDKHIESKANITEVFYDNIRLNMFVLKRKLLLELILQSNNSGYNNLIEVINLNHELDVNIYKNNGFTRIINSVKSYFESNLDIINTKVSNVLFSRRKPVITKSTNTPSTFYRSNSKVNNSLVANGSILNGIIKNSVLFRSLNIGKGTVINNSIINQGCIIGKNCVLENVILDKECVITDGVKIIGKRDNPILLRKKSKIIKYKI